MTLTGLNTFLCALTLPLLGTWALGHYVEGGQMVPILFDNALRTIAVVLLPVLAGMAIAVKAPQVAARVQKPVKILTAILMVVFSVGAVIKEWNTLIGGFALVDVAILAFNAICLLTGFNAARAAALDRQTSITIAFQASIHIAIQAN